MILDTIENGTMYAGVYRGFAKAFSFLRDSRTAGLADGRHAIDGDRIYAVVMRGPLKAREAARVEAHRKYIDIQYVVAGREEMGWLARARCVTPDIAYNETKDIEFFKDRPDTWLTVEPGWFAAFFPVDGHAPMAGAGEVHKVVVKIAL